MNQLGSAYLYSGIGFGTRKVRRLNRALGSKLFLNLIEALVISTDNYYSAYGIGVALY